VAALASAFVADTGIATCHLIGEGSKVPSRLPSDSATICRVDNHENRPAPDGISTLPGAGLISS
jgi:hypothetical protein